MDLLVLVLEKAQGGNAVQHRVDHEKRDVQQIELQFVAWSTERMVELCHSAEAKTRRIAETCDPLDRAGLSSLFNAFLTGLPNGPNWAILTAMYRLGMDLGGTKIEGIALDGEGRECFRRRVPTEKEKGYEHILRNMTTLYGEMVRSIGGAPHTFGIGTPGALSVRTGLLKNSNTVCMNGRPVKEDLEQRLDRRIAIQNDANCFAMAEAAYGAGKGHAMVFGVIMGTGCGGGLVYKGEVWTGPQAIGGEWGHMSIDPNGPVCYCGTRGCVETYISGGGLENRYYDAYGLRRPLKSVEADYEAGEPRAVAFMGTFFRNFGRAVANLINVLDPDIVVLGGGVSNMEAIYTEGVKEVARQVFSDSFETPIVKHGIGDSAGVIGAALIGI